MSLCLGGGGLSTESLVVVGGFAYRLAAEALTRELCQHGPLLELLLRHVQSVMCETGQIAACSRHHALHARLSRWLLSLLDRVSGSVLPLTHDVIAYLLGVRREGVSHELGALQREGVVDCGRGYLDVRDRPALEARACECYAIVRRAHDYLGARPPRVSARLALP